MRIVFQQRVRGEIDFGLLYGGIVLFGLVIARFLPVARFLPSCLFRASVGVPCPSCGTTRSVLSLMRGDVAGSFTMNPLAAVLIIGALLIFLYSSTAALFRLPRPVLLLVEKERRLVRMGAVILLVANWAYLITRL